MMTIQIVNTSKLNNDQRMKIQGATGKGIPVLNWHSWQETIANASYKESKGYNGREILALIQKNGIMSLDINGYFERSNTIGYTYIGQTKQWINTKYLDADYFTEADLFGHIMHEVMHWRHGFKHTSRFTKKQSVPYRVGNISANKFVDYYAAQAKGQFVVSSFLEGNICFEILE